MKKEDENPNRPASTAMTAAGTAKLPVPVMLFMHPDELGRIEKKWSEITLTPKRHFTHEFNVAVIPVTRPPSAAKLKAAQRLLEMSEEELYTAAGTAMSKEVALDSHREFRITRCILRALNLLPLSTARRCGRKGK